MGLIYLEIPGSASALDAFEIEIGGAVEAPRFVLGKTELIDWQTRIRHLPGPWAEIGSSKMIVTVPSEVVRELMDPSEVAGAWARVLDLDAELAARPLERRSPERLVTDEQISAGYMHAGYPIMTHLDVIQKAVSVEHLTQEGNWGFFHEVGHNHQSGLWTFGGTGEVTVNLFSLYVFEHLVGIPVKEHPRGSQAFLNEQMAKYDFDNPDFDQWKSDPFLALTMYTQLQHQFGWEAYREVFATYRALPSEEHPKNDAEERDQWMQRFSRQIGYNLAPFFDAWGIPISQEARDSVTELPVWMPADFPPNNPQPTPPLHTPGATAQPPSSTPTPDIGPAKLYLPQLHFGASD